MVRRVFVYGTLKSGQVNDDAMYKLGGTCVGSASMMRAILIETHGMYPYMIPATDWRSNAIGELWEFPDETDFKPLDQIEVPAGYIPTMVDVTLTDTEATYHCEVIAYMYPGIYYDGTKVRHITSNLPVKVAKTFDSENWVPASQRGLDKLFNG